MITSTITLPGFDAYFDSQVKKEIEAVIKRAMPIVIPKIKKRVGDRLRARLTMCPEYTSLKGGTLYGEIGLDEPDKLDRIIDLWVNGIEVGFFTGLGLGLLRIRMIRADYSDVLSSADAAFLYVSARNFGILDWLRWLLIEGTTPIVKEYRFDPTRRKGSRTGRGIMVHDVSASWSVPAAFAGTVYDNFVTRAIAGMESEIEVVVKTVLQRDLK